MNTQKRFFIIGTMGSGKTTLSRKIADKLKIPAYSLDNFYWTTKYTRKRNEKVRDKMIKNLAKKKSWAVEGVFSSWVGPLVKKADLVIWLDLHPNILSWNIIKRFIKNTFSGNEKERGNLADNWKIIVHARKYRTGEHKNSYKGHKALIDKHKPNYVRIENKIQLKKLEEELLS